jgi:hypothetical protein
MAKQLAFVFKNLRTKISSKVSSKTAFRSGRVFLLTNTTTLSQRDTLSLGNFSTRVFTEF